MDQFGACWLAVLAATSAIAGCGEVRPGASDAGADSDGGPLPGDILYVSAGGSDDDDGRTKESPKRTIAGAIEAAKVDDAVREIHVCAGVYPEPDYLVLDVAVSLLGAWDCSDWTQTGTYGYPSFDAVNETLVTGPDDTALSIAGAQVDESVLVDGFTIRGGDPNEASFAVLVYDGAAPRISNNRLLGGSGIEGSTGIGIHGGGAPEVTANDVDGGSGGDDAWTGLGSVGLSLAADAGDAWIHGNRISGGAGRGENGSVGVQFLGGTLREADGRPFQDNEVNGGSGAGGDGLGSAGLLISGSARVDVVDNFIDGGLGQGGTTGQRGVLVAAASGAALRRNRIYGGHATLGVTAAIGAYSSPDLAITDNLLYGGNRDADPAAPAAVVGVYLTECDGPVIQHDTIFVGHSAASDEAAIHLDVLVRGAVIENNVMFGGGGPDDAVFLRQCPSEGGIDGLRNNAMFGFSRTLLEVAPTAGGCVATASLPRVDDMEAALAAGSVDASGNVVLHTVCDTDSGCVSVAGCDGATMACADVIFDDWGIDASGFDSLVGDGWSLSTAAPCVVAESSLDLGLDVDLAGAERTPPPSMGAMEHDGFCTP